ncbi:hypothetical protein KEM54_006646 [Ascosphaera aggregata]|nr:hypothetical protein KEM54_006646 [Ascosphaera aggregata]
MTMALTSWKAFNFFEVTPVEFADNASRNVLNSNISSLCSSPDYLFLGTGDGMVYILSPDFALLRSFQAYDVGSNIVHLSAVQVPSQQPKASPVPSSLSTPLLVTIGEDLPNLPILKVWDTTREDKKTGSVKCLTTLTIQNGGNKNGGGFPTSAFASLPDLSQVVVGFANGSVTIIRGDLVHERGTKQTTIFESEEPVTNLSIRLPTTLFISTTNRILTMSIAGKIQGQTPRTLENMGCAVGCMDYDSETGDIVVAREDAIYTYRPHGRGPSFGLDALKGGIKVAGDYLALTCPPRTGTGALERMAGDEIMETTKFVILDPDLRFVAHVETMLAGVRFVIREWGDLYILDADGKVYRYHEKSLQQKLEILYQRNLYILAINMAQKAGIDRLSQNVIFRKYGDFLYSKGDYDTAMQQYLRAIDNTEPSQVIRKFLDTQHIHNLIEYLEELHYHGKATADHTTLLLNCYAKLKDTTKLDSFIRESGPIGGLKFDLDTAIRMCRQGGYFEQAAYLAEKYGESDLVVDILVEDSKDYNKAIEFLRTVPADKMYANLMKFSRVLLGHHPEDTTRLFVDFYTGQYKPVRKPGKADEPQEGAGTATEQDLTYATPKPRTAFSSFVDQPRYFIQFLEALLTESELQEDDKTDVYTTLFEMYLDTAKNIKNPIEKAEWEKKAKKLIEGKEISMSTSNVLLLSDLSSFREGTTLVQEQAGLLADIFRSYTTAKDTSGVIKALQKYGSREPQLYVDALTYFTSSKEVLEEVGDELDKVLQKIDQDRLLSPLQVVQALSGSDVVSMGMVKTYLSMHVEKERKEIMNNRKLINIYTRETAAKRAEIVELTTKPVTFQARRCAACGGALDLPIVHFMCKHSFHKRCLNIDIADTTTTAEEELQCPICTPQNQTVRAIRRKQLESASDHDVFKDQLERSADRFGVISDWFGRGVMRPGAGVVHRTDVTDTRPSRVDRVQPDVNFISRIRKNQHVILDSDSSDLEIDESTSATQFVQARSASCENPCALQATTINVYQEFPRSVEGYCNFSPLVSRNHEHVAVPTSMSAEGVDGMNQGSGISSSDGTCITSSSPNRLNKIQSRSSLKRGKTTSEVEWNVKDNDGDCDCDNQTLQGNTKRRKTVDLISDGNLVNPPADGNASPALKKGELSAGTAHQQYRGRNCESESIGVQSPEFSPLKARNSLSSVEPQYGEKSGQQPNIVDNSSSNHTMTPLLPRKRAYDRTRSAQEIPVSQGDTELMSSETFARAKRALTMEFNPKSSEATNDSTDELALPLAAPSTCVPDSETTTERDRTVSFEQPVPLALDCAVDHTLSQSYNIINQVQHDYEQPAWNLNLSGPANASMGNYSIQGNSCKEQAPRPAGDGDMVMTEAVQETIAPVQAEGLLTEAFINEEQPKIHKQTCNPAEKVLPTNEIEHSQEKLKPTTKTDNGLSVIAIPFQPNKVANKGNAEEETNSRSSKISSSKRKSSAKIRIATPEKQNESDIEGLIGLPKEMYRPRPSRSRSQTFEEYMGLDRPPSDERSRNEESKCEERSRTPNKSVEEQETEERVKSSKIRRKQVKRGKTTSAAMGKRLREPGIEDDVIWIDDCNDDEGPAALVRREGQSYDYRLHEKRACTPHEAMTKELSSPRSTSKFAVVITTPRKQQLLENGVSKRKGTNQSDVPDPMSPTRRKSCSRKSTRKGGRNDGRQENISKRKNTRGRTKSIMADATQIEGTATITPEPVSDVTTGDQPPEEVDQIGAAATETVAQSSRSEPNMELNEDTDSVQEFQKSPKIERTTPAPGLSFETPTKTGIKAPPDSPNKGPNQHSPIPINKRVPYRVGLSRKVRVAPLLKVIRK